MQVLFGQNLSRGYVIVQILFRSILFNKISILCSFSVIGVWKSKRSLLLPWLLVQGLLASLLSAMALYFLVLFPEQTDCFSDKPSSESEDKFFHPFYEMYEDRTLAPFNPGPGQCTILLWYSVVMVLSLLVLIYYVYIVQVNLENCLTCYISICLQRIV